MARRSTLATILVLLAASVLLAAGCQDGGGAGPAASAAPSASEKADAAISARRPTRRYYLGRTENRCEVFWVDTDQVSAPSPTPCPADLLPGERMRIAGKTCIREGSDPERREPVVCPDPLTNAEKRDLAAAAAERTP